MTLTIRVDDPAAAHVADLLAFHLAELRSVMSGEFAFALDASRLSQPSVTFWTAWREDAMVGFAALKRLGEGQAEVKSMRAAPAARGTGVGQALLRHVIARARGAGVRELMLETGTASTHDAAVGLYHKHGFVDCPPFADYKTSPHNRFMTLILGD